MKNLRHHKLCKLLCMSCEWYTASMFTRRGGSALNAENWANEFNHLIKGNAINSQLVSSVYQFDLVCSGRSRSE